MSDRDIPDKCWQAKYGNDSRKWILNYELNADDPKPTSAMKEQYRPPGTHACARKDIAKRREIVRNKVVAAINAEIEAEINAKPSDIEYCTTYEEKFNTIPGFVVHDNPPENKEMSLKYPLYESPPVTIWTDIVGRTTKESTKVAGMTKIAESMNIFKRNSKFTEPIEIRLDNAEM